MIIKVNPVMMSSVHGNLCIREYYNHKHGCPNFAKKTGCPPNIERFDKARDLDRPVFAIYTAFPFGNHVRRMKKLHPEWSDRQAECCLYWQGKARKRLKEEIEEFIKAFKEEHFVINSVPEAWGVDVTKTMANAGVFLEWPPKCFSYQVALAAYLNQR